MNKKPVWTGVIILGLCLLVSGCVVRANEHDKPVPMAEVGSIISAHMIDDQIGWLLTETAIFKSNEGGLEWTDITPASFVGVSDIKAGFIDDITGCIALFKENAANLEILRTSDGGQTWTSFNIDSREGQMAPWPAALTFTDSDHGWLVTSYGVAMGSNWVDVYVTEDGGQSWQLVASGTPTSDRFSGLPLGGLKTGLGAADSQKAWLTGFSYGDGVWLYGTTDGGQNWRPVKLPVDPTYSTEAGSAPSWPPVFVDSHNGFLPVIFGDNDCVVFYRTRNGGNTWEQTVPVSVTDQQPVWDFVDSEHGFVAAGDKLHVTGDGGQSWQSVDLKLIDVTQVDFITAKQGWAVSEGKLFSTADGGQTWVQVTK